MSEIEAGAQPGAGEVTTPAPVTTEAPATIAADPNKTASENAAPAAAEKPTENPTIAATAGEVEKPQVPADWPGDWRDRFAENIKPGDKKFRERLDRFASPLEIGKSWLAAETKISTGEVKKPFPDQGTDEEKAAWRKDAGLPEKAEQFVEKLELPKGVVLGDADKPIMEDFAKAAFDANLDQRAVNTAAKWYFDFIDRQNASRDAADDEFHQKSDDALRAEWGPDYRRHLNAVSNLLSTLPDEMHLKDSRGNLVPGGMLVDARLPNGRKLGDYPAVLKWLANQALELNPVASLIPAGAGDISSADTEIARIETLMRDKTSEYWRGPKAADTQQRYRELLAARDKLKNRAA